MIAGIKALGEMQRHLLLEEGADRIVEVLAKETASGHAGMLVPETDIVWFGKFWHRSLLIRDSV